MPVDEETLAGQAAYFPLTLALYDAFILGFSNRWVWRCPAARLLAHYDRHVSANHLDVGVATGYFLDRCRFPAAPRIALVDLNANSLHFAARRIRRFRPRTYRRNALEPLELGEERFDSAGMNYLLHCLPGAPAKKAAAFDHVRAYVNPGGVIFGATLLQGGVRRSAAARGLMAFYNRWGMLHNAEDDLAGLERALAERFEDWGVEVAGCAALFWART